LKNRRIVITRPEDQATDFARSLSALGAEPVLFPTIRIIAPKDWNEVDKAILRIDLYDSLIFTSVNGVKFFIQRFKKKRGDFGVLRNLRICAIGPQTAAAVEQLNLRVAVIPKEFRAESVLDALEEEGIRGRRFLLPRAEKAREILPEEIRKRGGYIDVVPAYRTGKASGMILRKGLSGLQHGGEDTKKILKAAS
jgi:uroporphyrinogen III methyltransferase/synthase